MIADRIRSLRSPATAGLALLILLAGGCRESASDDPGELRDAVRTEGAPMCPWRHPKEDIAAWFPGATRLDTEVQILSGLRPELARRLGRPATAEENALYLHRVWKDAERLGEVAVRRVKGGAGAVEVVVAFEPDGRVRGVRVQRTREPAEVVAALDGTWLDAFRGRRSGDSLRPGADLPAVPEAARATASALADGVRSLLLSRELANHPGAVRRLAPEASAGHDHVH